MLKIVENAEWLGDKEFIDFTGLFYRPACYVCRYYDSNKCLCEEECYLSDMGKNKTRYYIT